MRLRAPFPWFGGKSRVAHLVWEAFGSDVPNYVEPFAGSLAVLLGRPGEPRIETVNDLDSMVANFWRAVQRAPEKVARFADWPVNEADLHARHLWLVNQADFRERMKTDPKYFDAQIAGWWVWGISQWIGGGWCALPKEGCKVEKKRPKLDGAGGVLQTTGGNKRPHVGNAGRGVASKMPKMDRGGLSRLQPPPVKPRGGRKPPQIGGTKGAGVHKRSLKRAPGNQFGYWGARAPQGVNAVSLYAGAPKGVHARGLAAYSRQRPHLSDGGRGAVALSVRRQLPCISGDGGATGRGVHASAALDIYGWMRLLAERLRRVRVCCGDWRRILGPSPTTCIGVTAVFLDPPYPADAGRDLGLYAEESGTVAHDVAEWAMDNGDNPKLRIAFCGYEGAHRFPETWQCVPWEAAGGYGSKANARRERVWFSPHCLTVQQQLPLFGGRHG